MSFAPSGTIAGSSQPGFTTPTYGVTPDIAPVINAKQFAITALGGTQAGAEVNSVSKPFTMTFFRPAVLRTLPQVNPTTGVIRNIPYNTYKLITRKGAVPALNQGAMVARITTMIEIPAGADTFDAGNIKAMLSSHIGVLNSQSSGIADTVVTGIL